MHPIDIGAIAFGVLVSIVAIMSVGGTGESGKGRRLPFLRPLRALCIVAGAAALVFGSIRIYEAASLPEPSQGTSINARIHIERFDAWREFRASAFRTWSPVAVAGVAGLAIGLVRRPRPSS